MTILVIAEHDNHALQLASSHAIAAAGAFGAEVHVLVAGADCGFSSRASYKPEVHPTVVWPKMQHLALGAQIASKQSCPATNRFCRTAQLGPS